MSMEHAFLRALEANPTSRLIPRVRKGIRHSRKEDRSAEDGCYLPQLRQLRYRWQQLGRMWASLRLGGCSWVGPIPRLREEWQQLWAEVDERGAGDGRADLLQELAIGIGLDKAALDRRGREYLMRLLASRSGDAARLCRVEGIRCWSPLTVFVEAVSDLAGHDCCDTEAFHAFLAERTASDPSVDATPQLPQLCRAVAIWLEDE